VLTGWMDTYLLLVVETLVVVFKDGCAFCFARVVFGVCVGCVACEDFLPEGEAARWAWGVVLVDVEVFLCRDASCGIVEEPRASLRALEGCGASGRVGGGGRRSERRSGDACLAMLWPC
jgi:hypothetical protein